MPQFEVKEKGNHLVFGELKDINTALNKINKSFSKGWLTNYLLENSEVILIEGSFILGTKEHPIKITGKGKNRIATLVK